MAASSFSSNVENPRAMTGYWRERSKGIVERAEPEISKPSSSF